MNAFIVWKSITNIIIPTHILQNPYLSKMNTNNLTRKKSP